MSGTKTTDIWGLWSMMKPNNHPIFVEMNWNLNALFVVIVYHLLGMLKKKKKKEKLLFFLRKLSFFPGFKNNFAVKDVGLWCLCFSHQCISLIWNMLQKIGQLNISKPAGENYSFPILPFMRQSLNSLNWFPDCNPIIPLCFSKWKI